MNIAGNQVVPCDVSLRPPFNSSDQVVPSGDQNSIPNLNNTGAQHMTFVGGRRVLISEVTELNGVAIQIIRSSYINKNL